MQNMPGFSHQLSDAELADLTTYPRVRFGGLAADVPESAVKAMR